MEKTPESREMVVPGMILTSDPSFMAGRGALATPKGIISLFVGLKEIRGKYVNVVPLNGLYNPNVGDKVIGIITDRTPVKWIVDIGSKYEGTLRLQDSSPHSSRGHSGKNFGSYRVQENPAQSYKIGDVIICKILSGDRVNEPEVSTLGNDLGKINNGMVINIPSQKVPRVIGRKGSMIAMLKQQLDLKLFVAQNGRIWLRGKSFVHERLLIDIIHKIEREAHTVGLTDRIKYYILKEKQKRGIQ